MALSKTAICNMALRHIGVSLTIANIDLATERSNQARACRDFYDTALDELFRDFDWPFARRVSPAAGLALIASAPSTEWLYSYRLPADLIIIRRVISGLAVRYDTVASRVPYAVYGDDTGLLLYSDVKSAAGNALVVVYTARVTDVTKFPPDFAQAFALLLAGYIAPSLTQGDELKLGERALAKYDWRLKRAWANAANQEQPDQPGDGELVTTRN